MGSQRSPPGSLFLAALGGAAGAGLGLAAYGLLWMSQEASGGVAAAYAHTTGPAMWEQPAVWFLLVGALAGFFAVGGLIRNRLAMRLLAAIGKSAAIVAGCLVGAFVGCAAYLIAWMASNPGHSVSQGLTHMTRALGRPGDAFAAFLAAGILAGLLGTMFLVGRGAFRLGARVVTGTTVGGLVGLVIYSVAFVLVNYPEMPRSSTYFLHFGEAVRSLAPAEFLFVGIGVTAGVLLSNYSWKLYGILTFMSLLCVVLGYALYTTTATLPAVVPEDLWFSYALFAAELASLCMVLLYSFYTIDVAARKHWRRTTEEAPFSPYYLPKVAIHVPTYNEPFEIVQGTLASLVALDYPEDRVMVMVGDDSTDPECSEPLRRFCQENGIAYLHRRDRRGYKAGALNALLDWTPKEYNVIAVVDADYVVEPEFLRETVGYFVDPSLGWLQTPQDYRNRNQSFLTEQYYLADAYFYRTILPSRNEENSIIFCGTMGMLRRRAVEEVGGWGEKYITEDAELSVRFLNAGWRSLYVNKTYGRGLIPPTFEGYKRQQYRWAFGGGRILRGHLLRFLFGRFTFRQRLDYLVGSLNWFEGAFILAIAFSVLGLGLAELAGLELATHHDNEVLLIGLVPIFLLLDGLTRVHLVLRRSIHLTFGGTVRMLGMWFSVKFSNTRAALKGLLGFSIPFVRTPKAPSERLTRGQSLSLALRLTPFESVMALLMLCTAVAVAVKAAVAAESALVVTAEGFLAFWLFYYSFLFTAAPLYAYKSFATLAHEPRAPAADTTPTEVQA